MLCEEKQKHLINFRLSIFYEDKYRDYKVVNKKLNYAL